MKPMYHMLIPTLFLLFSILHQVECAEYFVCGEVGDMSPEFAAYIGAYSPETEKQFTYTNNQGKSIFRHGPYWYMGDVSVWPPVTDFRCVNDACPHNSETPPVGATFTKSKSGLDPPPSISLSPCKLSSDEF